MPCVFRLASYQQEETMKPHKTMLPPQVYYQALALGMINETFFDHYRPLTETDKLLVRLNTSLLKGEIKVENP